MLSFLRIFCISAWSKLPKLILQPVLIFSWIIIYVYDTNFNNIDSKKNINKNSANNINKSIIKIDKTKTAKSYEVKKSVINLNWKIWTENVSQGWITSSWTFKIPEYKELCNKKDEKYNFLCTKVESDFFYNNYFGECSAIKDNKIDLCKNQLFPEFEWYCKWNYYIYQAATKNDSSYCDIFKTDFKEAHISLSKDNYSFCMEMYDLSQNFTQEKLIKSNMDNFWNMELKNHIDAEINKNPNLCYKISWIDARMKCLIYSQWLKCDQLNNKDYIYSLLDNTSYFYFNETK